MPELALYERLLTDVGQLLDQGRRTAARVVNQTLVQTYWLIGRHIVEFEQAGREKAEYGSNLLDRLSRDLSERYGKGFSRSNLSYIRQFYFKYPIRETVSHELGWGHYFELLKLDDDLERSFYEKQSVLERWSVRELKRQKQTSLFHRLALSRDKESVLKLAREGNTVERPEDLLRDPYVLDFLSLPESPQFSETALEQALIDNLQQFLLELGKGFAFVGRQYRITLSNRHYRVDLVFYHRILKCFVLIDLKRGEVTHEDVGQMNLYLNYFKKEENVEDDRDPVGIILAAEKDRVLVEYATGGLSNHLFVSKYQLHLPEKALLEARLRQFLEP